MAKKFEAWQKNYYKHGLKKKKISGKMCNFLIPGNGKVGSYKMINQDFCMFHILR